MFTKIYIRRGEDLQLLIGSALIMAIVSLPFAYWQQARACGPCAVSLTATVATSLSFTTTTGASDVFGTIQPNTAYFATTTLGVTTNDSSGWLVSLSGDNKTTSNNNLELAANAASVTDQKEWIPNSATSSPGNAVRTSSLDSSNKVLAFRVMTASTTNGTVFTANAWWGTTDSYVDSATTLWAGIASSTVQRTIGNAGSGSYSSSAHLNTVLYYLNVPITQQTGAYTAPLTFTATGN